MGADTERLARIEGAAKDVQEACARMREGSGDFRMLLEDARDAYLDALELANERLAREAIDNAEGRRAHVPMHVYDGIVDAADAVGSLGKALECVAVAVRSPEEDPTEYVGGALSALLVAADDAYGRAARLRDEAEGAMA